MVEWNLRVDCLPVVRAFDEENKWLIKHDVMILDAISFPILSN